jgi:phosphoribosylformylglycinamidine synthase
MPTIVVDVMPKAELLDPQGKAVTGSLARLGHGQFQNVRIGKRVEMTVAEAKKVAEEILSNQVIEDVISIEVV